MSNVKMCFCRQKQWPHLRKYVLLNFFIVRTNNQNQSSMQCIINME